VSVRLKHSNPCGRLFLAGIATFTSQMATKSIRALLMMSLKLWIRHTSQDWKVKTHAYATTWLGCTAKYCVIHVSVDMRSVFDSLVTPLSQISYCVCAELIHPYIQQRLISLFNSRRVTEEGYLSNQSISRL
jgi:hypothetical protein